jgi:hypothetical protein
VTDFWFQPVLHFANTNEPENVEALVGETEIVFASEGGRTWTLWFPWGRTESATEEQTKLRKLLEVLSSRGPTRSLWIQVAKMTLFTRITGRANFGVATGHLKFTASITPENLEQWYGFALAELIAQGLGDRVRRCALDTCQRYFVAAKTKGPPKQFCSTNHASQARMKRKRQRDARR